jgi:hypothetical protein
MPVFAIKFMPIKIIVTIHPLNWRYSEISQVINNLRVTAWLYS